MFKVQGHLILGKCKEEYNEPKKEKTIVHSHN